MNDDRFMRILEESHFHNETFMSRGETIIGLWPDFSLACFNEGWFIFAQENDGEPDIRNNWKPGRNIFDCIPGELVDFYRSAYMGCLETGKPWGHEYECSSPDTFRLLHQQVYPLQEKKGLLLIHSTTALRPIEQKNENHVLENFINPDGFLIQCCHCRKFKNFGNGSNWIWLSELVRSLPENVSHGFCDRCRDFHYHSAGNRRAGKTKS